MFNNLNLREVNKILDNRMENCELISDLNLSRVEYEQLLSMVINVLEYVYKGDNLNLLVKKNSLIFACILVYIAMYEYEGNYWDKAKEILNFPELSQQSRTILAENVLKVINKYNLKNFGDNGYKYVTPIMCHAGIPNKSLPGIFDIMLDNYDDNTLTAEALIDNIKYFIKHRVDKTVYRFITFNEDRAITFLHNLKDIVAIIEDNKITLSELLESYNYLDERIIIQYYKWRNEKKIDKEKKQSKNRIFPPKIKFDGASLGVCLYLPVQHINKNYNDFVEWSIEYDNGENINISGDLYYQNRECITGEQNIALMPSNLYKINLNYDDEVLGKWIYDGIGEEKPYMIFDEDDNVVKGNKISNKIITCILHEGYKVDEKDLAITYCNLPNKYWFNFKCVSILLLEQCDFISLVSSKEEIKINYKKISIIELKNGKFLFNERNKKEEIPMYSGILPEIALEYGNSFFKNMIIDTYSLMIINLKENISIVQSIKSSDYIISSDRITIDLNQLEIFKKMIYGEYEIRIFEGRNIKKVFTIRYLPRISISESTIDRWPKDKRGYIKNSFKIVCPSNVVFNFTDCIQEEVFKENMKNILIETLAQSEYLIGSIDITESNKVITFPVKKKIRNLQWSLIKEGEQKIKWEKAPNTLFIKELIDDNYCLVLKINDDINDEYTIKLFLVDHKNRLYQDTTTKLRYDKLHGIPLNQFLDSIKSNEASRYFIKIEVYNKYNHLLSSFIPLIIKEKITTKNIRYVNNGSGIVSIRWKQEGKIDKDTMVLKLYNISKPWNEQIIIPLDKGCFNSDNSNCILQINSDQFLISEDGVYLFEIEDNSITEDTFIEPNENFKPMKILNSNVYKYKNNFQNIVDSMKIHNMKDAIFYFVYCFDTKYIEKVYGNIKILKITEEYDNSILESIYNIYSNRRYFISNCREVDKNIVQHIIILLMAKFANKYNLYKIIEDLMDIDESFINSFFDRINKHNLNVDREYIIPIEKRNILWNLDKEKSFIIETRSGRISKNILTNNIIDWLNIRNFKDILVHGEQCQSCNLLNNKGCLNKYLKGKCQGRTLNLSSKLIGSKSEYEKLFSCIDTTDKRVLNKLDSINLLEHFEDDGIKLFNKSYVEIMYTWSNENGTESRGKLFCEIKECIDLLRIYIKKEYQSTIFGKLYNAFLKRKDNNPESSNTLAYYLGTVVLIMSLDSFGKLQNEMSFNERRAITKLYNKFRDCLKELFIRDLVLVELYVTGLGE